jgi:hypothetical protein
MLLAARSSFSSLRRGNISSRLVLKEPGLARRKGASVEAKQPVTCLVSHMRQLWLSQGEVQDVVSAKAEEVRGTLLSSLRLLS